MPTRMLTAPLVQLPDCNDLYTILEHMENMMDRSGAYSKIFPYSMLLYE